MRGRRSIAVCLLLGLAPLPGCTTTSTDPTAVSFGDLTVGYGRLKEYLAQRNAHLQALRQQTADLDDRIMLQLGQLHRAQRELSTAAATEAASRSERAALEQQVRQQQADLERVRAQVVSTERQIQTLQGAKGQAEADRQRDEAELTAVKQSVAQLSEEYGYLDAAVERSLELKARQLREAEPVRQALE